MSQTLFASLASVLVLWGLTADANPAKHLDYYHRTAKFESGHDVCGGSVTLEFQEGRALLFTSFTKCAYLTLKRNGVILRQENIAKVYELELDHDYVGLFTNTKSAIAGDKIEVNTSVPAVEPPPPPPPPPPAPTYKYKTLEIWPGQAAAIIPECGGAVSIERRWSGRYVKFENVAQCRIVQVQSLYFDSLSIPMDLNGGNYSYYGEFEATKWQREVLVYELTSSHGGRGVDIIVHVY